MSQQGFGPAAVPPAGEQGPGWPTAPPPHRSLGPGDPAEKGPYRLEAVLGAGGMGRVYLGRTPAGSAVAVKVVHREYAGDTAFRRRFEQEVAAARRVQGLYTVPVVDADLTADEPWLATAYVPGPSLHDAVTEHGPLPAGAAMSLIARVAEALQSIHAADVIHRDLKPSNIILTAEGPKVIDFGIARAADVTSLTGTGMLTGTPAFMAPEYIRGQTVTEAVDVFALGGVAAFAATGTPPFGGGSGHHVTYRILEQAPDLDDCPEPVRTIAARCLEKDPSLRLTAAEVVQHCNPAAAADPEGPGHTVLSPPRARTVVTPEARFHDAATSPASPGATRDPAGGAVPLGPTAPRDAVGADPASAVAAAAPSTPAIVAGLAALVLVIVLLAVLLPDDTGPKTPESISPTAHLTDFSRTNGHSAVAFSPDGKTLVAAGGDRLELWDVARHKRRATMTQPEDSEAVVTGIESVAFSPDGKRLAVGAIGASVSVWDVATRRQISVATLDSIDDIRSVAFSPDGSTLASGGDGGVRLWDARGSAKKLKQLVELDGESQIKEVAFSPDGKTLAAAGGLITSSQDDYRVQLWDVAGRKVRRTMEHSDGLWSVAYSPDGKTVATTEEDYAVRLWNAASGTQAGTLDGEEGVEFRSVAFSPDGGTVAAVHGESVVTWDAASHDEITELIGHQENLADVVFQPHGRYVVTITFDGESFLWKMP